MTALAGPAVIPDRTGRWLVCGVAFSLVLHGLAVAAWLWQPQTTLIPMSPAAVPMVVTMVGPVTSPKPQPMQDVGPAQPEISASAPPPPVAEPEPETAPLVPAPKADKPSPLRASEKKPEPKPKPKPKPRKPVERTVKKAEPKPAPVTEANSHSERAQQSQRAQAEQSVNAPQSDRLSAPRQGQTSVQHRAAKISWQQKLHAHLERHKRYPRHARRQGREGMPRISFTMDRSGKVLSASLVGSSGTSSLDKEALALVRRASPLPKPPAVISGTQLTLTVPINFSL